MNKVIIKNGKKLPDNTRDLVSEVRPDLVKFFKDKNLVSERGINSKEKTWFKCPDCGEEEFTSIRTFVKEHTHVKIVEIKASLFLIRC